MAEPAELYSLAMDAIQVRDERETVVRTRHPEQFALVGALLASALVIVLGFSDYRQASRASILLNEARAASTSMEYLLKTVLDAETGQRGFLLTSSPSFLRPYESAVRDLASAKEQFRLATHVLPLDPVDCGKIETLATNKMAELAQTVRMAENGDRARVLQLVAAGQGNHFMEQLRATGARMEGVYERYAVLQQQRVAKWQLLSLTVTVLGSGLVAAVLVWVTRRLRNTQSEQAQLLLRMSEREKQYQKLADRLHAVREEERGHLAREIHDVLGQAFTGIKLDIAAAGRRLEKDDKDAALEKLGQGIQSVDESIRLLRKIASELRPPLLDHVGLVASIKAYAEDYAARTGVALHVEGENERMPLSADERIAIYRICQESLTNIARHSETKEAWIKIAQSSELITLKVEDHGKGFDTKKKETSLGLLGMRERARSIGADLLISGAPGSGVVVELLLPRSV
jgi:signal transduction histidine kinase